jgi:hypothetical protein
MALVNYTYLLDQNNLISWLTSISETDPNPTIRTAAKKIAFNVSGNKIIESWYYYNELYKKYQFKLVTINTINGFNVVLYSYTNQGEKFIGSVKKYVPAKPIQVKSLSVPIVDEIGTTYDRTPSISGFSDANLQIYIYDGGQLLGQTTSNELGEWEFTVTTNLSFGNHSITAVASNGTEFSNSSKVVNFTILEITVPTVTFTSPTDDTTPTITGTAPALSTVTVYNNESPIGTTTADSEGNWSFTLT